MPSSKSCRVYVGRIPSDCRSRDLERFFRNYGYIKDCLVKNGYGFVEFEDYKDADDAVYEKNGKELLGKRKDTPVRLLGYANEVGESFRALTPLWFVRATYGVASAYVLADTFDKGNKMKKLPDSTTVSVAHAAVDTLVWQAFASVIIPGFAINRLCFASLLTMAKVIPQVSLTTRKWTTTAIGLGCIPFIVHPIDNFVHYAMNKSIRKYIKSDEPIVKD